MARTEIRRCSARGRGFGLIELVIAIAIVAILTATAVPSVREMGRRMTVTENANNVVVALNAAKAEAVKRGAIAGLIGSGNNWSAGWVVRTDSNSDGALTSADALLSQYGAVAQGYGVKTHVTGGADAQIVFGPQGSLSTPATAADVNVCRPDSQPALSVWVHVDGSGAITSHKNTAGSPAPGC
jgi:type IV fimbrial biogenesis protein FimT